VNEKFLYMIFKETLSSDLADSSRIARTGTLALLLSVLEYGFAADDERLR
jgi:hypothetical protein